MPRPNAKPLSRLKNTSKGSIHHLEIHPAKNSRGGQAFITSIHRNPPPSQPGQFTPSQPPEETPHEDGQDMLDHVGSTFGIKPEDDGSDED